MGSSYNAFADYPVVSHSYLADPGVLVHEGRVYVYCSNDNENEDDGYLMSSIVCVSSADLKNWTYHGVVLDVPRDAGWATHTWAPSPAYKNGQFYLYFANNASNVGVTVSDSPLGPFTDPIGRPLLTGNTPGVQPFNGWLFDPMTFIDDDGQAYCYFGGNGDDNMRAIRLNDDMISTQGNATTWNVPNFFEAAWVHKHEGKYYFSYSTTTNAGIRIDYMVSDNPMSGYTYGGVMSGQPPQNNNNNHQAVFQFNGEWYQMYHNRIVAMENGIDPVYHRNLAIDKFVHNGDGTIQRMVNTVDGLDQVGNLNPFERVEAETMSDQDGIDTEPSTQGGFNLAFIDNNDWIMVEGVDFETGASSIAASVASDKTGGSIEVRLGSPTGTIVGTLTVPNTGGFQNWQTVTTSLNGASGVHNVYFVFKGNSASLFNFDHWICYANGPIVNITSPQDNELFYLGDDITINATAQAQQGSITQVEFFLDGQSVGTDNSAPYSYTLTNTVKGSHSVEVIATDSQGDEGSAEVAINVNVPQGPYQGNIHLIPGTIEVEEYDEGGNGFAYFDDSEGSETGVSFRNDEDVDLEASTDAGGGYNLGWSTSGEWLEYTVEVTKAGVYDIELRVACAEDGRTVTVTMDGDSIATDLSIPNTTGWQVWQTLTLSDVVLTPGEKIMRITIGAEDFVNLNYTTFQLTEEFVKGPYGGTAALIPGRIEAENYDTGREGLGYHEFENEGNQGDSDYRNDQVDIEVTQDVEGEYNVAYIRNGEWLSYTVDVAADGLYDLDLRLAADGDGKTMHIEVDGEDITGSIDVPNTAGWQVWNTITVENIDLTAGTHDLRVVFDSDYMNFNYMEFRSQVVTSLNNTKLNELEIYPNPFNNAGLRLAVDGSFEYDIKDLKGTSLEAGSAEDNVLIGSSLEPGVYFITIYNNTGTQTKRVIKF